MKNKHILSLLLLVSTINIKAQTIFDWENNTTANTTTIGQTENGVTVTFTVGTNDPALVDVSGFAGTTGFVVVSGGIDSTNATFTFSSPVNITSIYAAEATNHLPNSADWTFAPTGGSNSNVVATIPVYGGGGVTVNLNWTNVTQFEVTSSESSVTYVFDNLIISSSLNAEQVNFNNPEVNLFPNPSTDIITVSGLKNKAVYQVIDYLGNEVTKGLIENNGEIDMKNIPNGIYFLKLNNGNSIKFVKE